MTWCHGCFRFCPGLDARGFCLDAPVAEIDRRSAAVRERCGLGPSVPQVVEACLSTALQTPEPEPGAAVLYTQPRPARRDTLPFLHRHQADFPEWVVFVDGEQVTEVWYAGAGLVQLADGGIRKGQVEIRAAGTAPVATPAPPVAPPVPPLPVAVGAHGQLGLEW